MNETTIERILVCASGYIELGMLEEAYEELEQLPDGVLDLPAALRVRLVLAVRSEDWVKGAQIGLRLVEAKGAPVADYLQTAFCLHELKRTEEARTVLLEAPVQAQKDSIYLYNMACYEAVLGRDERALDYLDRAAAIDGSVRYMAMQDPDLVTIRKFLKPGK